MGVWQFVTDARSDTFCHGIVAHMIGQFNSSEPDAFMLINRFWRLKDFVDDDPRHRRYDWSVEFWAEYIYAFVPSLIQEFGP
jgi:hypothetical protein